MKKIYSDFMYYVGLRQKPLVKISIKQETLELIKNREKAFLEKTMPVLEKYSKNYPSSGEKDLIGRCMRLKKREEDIKKIIARNKEAEAAEKLLSLKDIDFKEEVAPLQAPEIEVIGQEQE